MYIPPKKSDTHARFVILHKLGSATLDQWMVAGGRYSIYPGRFRTWLDVQLKAGRIHCADGVYTLCNYLNDYYDDTLPQEASEQEIVPSRTPPVWRPLNMRHIPSVNARRPDAPVFVERSHFTSGQSLEPFRGVCK